MATTSPPQYSPSWRLNQHNAQIAEGAGFRIPPLDGEVAGIWRHDRSLGLLARILHADGRPARRVTDRIQLYASVAILDDTSRRDRPRMASTIDDISGGRFGVNIVSGWNKREYEQMGLWRGRRVLSSTATNMPPSI